MKRILQVTFSCSKNQSEALIPALLLQGIRLSDRAQIASQKILNGQHPLPLAERQGDQGAGKSRCPGNRLGLGLAVEWPENMGSLPDRRETAV